MRAKVPCRTGTRQESAAAGGIVDAAVERVFCVQVFRRMPLHFRGWNPHARTGTLSAMRLGSQLVFNPSRSVAMRTSLSGIHLWLLYSLTASALPISAAAQSVSASEPVPIREVAKAAQSGVVNLNTASGDELERLPGIGPSRARAILELRVRLKRFARIEDLLRVKGIGRATFRRLRPLVTLQGPTTLKQ
jgi:competence ComEA-like helix-hairpin-helix protein